MAKSRIAETWVQVKPSVEGISDAISEEIRKGYEEAQESTKDSSEEAGEEAGKQAGKGMKAGLAVAAGAIAAVLGKVFTDAVNGAMEQAGQNAQLDAKLNLTGVESENVQDAVDALYTGAYGESREEVTAAMGSIVSTIKGARQASASELEGMGKDVLTLSSVWGVEASEISKAATTMLNTGMAKDWDDAIFQITAGMQTMGDKGEDWLDTLNEYSDDFVRFGLTGKSAINFINEALNAGAMDTDKIADALNEMSITIRDGSIDDTIKALGMDPNDLRARIAEGGDAAQGALLEVLSTLQKNGNVANYQKFMSSMGEDFNAVFQNMDLSKVNGELEEGIGNIDKIDEKIAETSSIESLRRTWEQAFIDTVIPLLEKVTPILIGIATWVNENQWAVKALAVVLGVVFLASVALLTFALYGMAAAGWAAMAPFFPLIGTIVLVIAFVLGLLVLINGLIVNWSSIWEWMTKATKATGEWFVGIWNNISEWWVSLWGGISDFFVGVWNNIADFFVNLWNGIVDFFVGIYETIVGIIDSILSFGGIFGDGVKVFFNTGGMLGKLGVPAMANGGTVKAKNGGTLALLGEAGRDEVVMDSGKWNKMLDNINSGKVSTGRSGNVTFNITQKENESTEQLVQRINEHLDFTGLR